MANIKQRSQPSLFIAASLQLLLLKITLFLILLETVWSFVINSSVSIASEESLSKTVDQSWLLSSWSPSLDNTLMTSATSRKVITRNTSKETQLSSVKMSVSASLSPTIFKTRSSKQETSLKASMKSILVYPTSVNSFNSMANSETFSPLSPVNNTRSIMLQNSSLIRTSQVTNVSTYFPTSSHQSKPTARNTLSINTSKSQEPGATLYSNRQLLTSSIPALNVASTMGTTKLSLISAINTSFFVRSTHHSSVAIDMTSSFVYHVSSYVPICPGSAICNNNKSKKNKDFLYIILGVSIGAAVIFFVVFMAVAICVKKKQQRKPSAHYKRSSKYLSERAADELLESKESVFNSSTLQLGKGVYNDGLEMDDSLLCILPNSPKTGDTQEDSSTTFRPRQDDVQPEPLTVHMSMEQVERVPSGMQPSAMFGIGKELKHDANIRLLQDWQVELSDKSSSEYLELKNEVEASIRDVYKSKEGFKDVRVEEFRKGSVIANVSLIVLAVVKNPLELLQKSVTRGKIGHLSVDKHFSVTRQEHDDDSSGDTYFDKRQPYMQRILSEAGKHKSTDNINQNIGDVSVSDAGSIESPPSAGSPSSDSFLLDSAAHGARATRKSTQDEKHDESNLKESNVRPTSLIDLRRVEPIKFRDQRDSGIGSMQELNKFESNRVSRQDSIAENVEQVFYDIPESLDGPIPEISTASNNSTDKKLKSPAEQGIAHVALFDFSGNDSRELSIKQGELLYVTQKDSFGWVKVVNAENYRGWVPTSFLVLVSQSQLASTQQTVETLEFFDNVLDELESESGSELSAASSPETEVYLEPTKTDVQTNTLDDADSHDYLTIIPEKNAELQASQCKSVYAFAGSDPTEMSFEEGVIITVSKKSQTGWWRGKVMDQEGWFPSSYVMPLKEVEDNVSNEMQSKLHAEGKSIIVDSLEDNEGNSQNICEQIYNDPVIYDEPDISDERKEHKYQSLKKQFKPPENYANLYLQILKRESVVKDDIEKYAAAIQVKLKEEDPERPLRSAPAPPREESRDKPTVPPRTKSQSPVPQQRKKTEGPALKPKELPSHGEPPKRPVPPPPTAKPTLMNIPATNSKQKDDVIFLDKGVTDIPIPASKIDYENVPKKPSHSAEFIKKENVKHPVPVVSLKNEFQVDESSSRNTVVSSQKPKQDPVELKSLQTIIEVKPNQESPPKSSRVSKDVPDTIHDLSDGNPASTEVAQAKKPLKPLPKLESPTNIPVPISRSKNTDKEIPALSKVTPVEKPPSNPFTSINSTEQSSQEATTTPVPFSRLKPTNKVISSSNNQKSSAKVAPSERPSKPLPSLDATKQSANKTSSPINVSHSEHTENGFHTAVSNSSAISVTKENKKRPFVPKKLSVDLPSHETDSVSSIQNINETSSGITNTTPVTSSSSDAKSSPRLKKPSVPSKQLPNLINQPTTKGNTDVLQTNKRDEKDENFATNIESQNASNAVKPFGFAIRKEDLLNKKAAIDQRGFSKPLLDKEADHHDEIQSIKLSELVNNKGNRTPPRPHERAVVKKPLNMLPKNRNTTGNFTEVKKPVSQENIAKDSTSVSSDYSGSFDSVDSATSILYDSSTKSSQSSFPKPKSPSKPLVSAGKPTLSAGKPTVSADKPMVLSAKPTISTDKPTVLPDKPTVSAGKPTVSADKPTISADKPTTLSDKPTISTDKPTILSDKPTVSAGKPTVLADKPTASVSLDKPTVSSVKPSAMPFKPAVLKVKQPASRLVDAHPSKHRDDKVKSPDSSKKARHLHEPVHQGSPKMTRSSNGIATAVEPVPAKRLTKETGVSVEPAEISSNRESLQTGNSRNSSMPSKDDAGPLSVSPMRSAPKIEDAPVPVPRRKPRPTRESQDSRPKLKPERPSSPPMKDTSQKDTKGEKPERPPLPSVQSPTKMSAKLKAKDRSKLRKVVQSYTKNANKELDLVMGELLFELASEGDISYGLLDNGLEGWYPSDHVITVDSTS